MAEAIVATKRCCRCKETKAVEDFNRLASTKDGLQKRCRACQRVVTSRWGQTAKGRATRRAIYRAWQKTPAGKAAVLRRYSKSKDTNAAKAGRLVRQQVKRGTLPAAKTLPCKACGKPATGYHHHLGYEPEHWLHVIPLCDPCHWKADHPDHILP